MPYCPIGLSRLVPALCSTYWLVTRPAAFLPLSGLASECYWPVVMCCCFVLGVDFGLTYLLLLRAALLCAVGECRRFSFLFLPLSAVPWACRAAFLLCSRRCLWLFLSLSAEPLCANWLVLQRSFSSAWNLAFSTFSPSSVRAFVPDWPLHAALQLCLFASFHLSFCSPSSHPSSFPPCNTVCIMLARLAEGGRHVLGTALAMWAG